MTLVEALPLLCSILAVVLSGIGMYSAQRRNLHKDTSRETSQLTTVIVKLETIEKTVSEVKSDLKDIKKDNLGIRERLLKCEQQIDYIRDVIGLHASTENKPNPQ